MNKALFLKQRIEWVFRRRGGNGDHVRLFDALGEAQQNYLRKNFECQENELPVLGGVDAPDCWMLLTTLRMVWRGGAAQHVLPIDAIGGTRVDLRALQQSQTPTSRWRRLEIIGAGGEKHLVDVEPGPPFFGLWNVLNFLGSRNRHCGAAGGH